MNTYLKENIIQSIQGFRLPTYQEIPDTGLYLDQIVQYINGYIGDLPGMEVTASMISNYVKKGMISRSTKKLYYREQIAYLIFIAVAKTVLSMDDICLLFEMQKVTYQSERAYNYFRLEFINVLEFVFDLKPTLEEVGYDKTQEKIMLRNTIITAAHKVYLEKVFVEIKKDKERSSV